MFCMSRDKLELKRAIVVFQPLLCRGEQRLVPLSLAEHSDRSAPLDHVTATVATLHYIAPDSNLQDIALSWEQPVDPIAFTESLAKAQEHRHTNYRAHFTIWDVGLMEGQARAVLMGRIEQNCLSTGRP